jgi:GMP synthase-like glutamine amidotransferase
VRTFHETTQKLVVGICFGHQVIARALGGQVQRSPGGWEVAVNPVHLSERGRQLFGRESLVRLRFSVFPLYSLLTVK